MDLKNTCNYILAGLALIAGLSLASCKKDNTQTYPSLTGVPEFSLPAYGKAGETFTFKAGGVTADDGAEVTYYWYANPTNTARDTSDTYTLTLADTLCTVTVYCTAFAEGYQSSSNSQSIVIVKAGRENGSISGLEPVSGRDFLYTDPRDGHEYLCTTVGSKDWFRENLAYKGSGIALSNCESASDVFGRFYNWNEARTACPEGWHVSTLDDWADAAAATSGSKPDPKERFYSVAGAFMGDLYLNGTKMWEYWPDVKITDKTGLSVIPLGYANKTEKSARFKSVYEYAAFWTADEKDAEQAYYRYFYDESPDLFIGSTSKASFAANVRCVRDHE